MSVSSLINFAELSSTLEKISKLSKSNDKQELLKKFFGRWRQFAEKKNLCNYNNLNKLDSFYPAMRLFLPNLDKNRSAFGIKEKTLAKLYCDILCIGEESKEGRRLLKQTKNAEDFADAAYYVLKERCTDQSLLTVEDINFRLDNIANASGANRKEVIKENLIFLQQNTNALDQKWLIQMILKHVSFGMTQKTIFKCYHPLAEDLYNVTSDLEAVCFRIKSYGDKVDSIDVQLYKAFKPMLSERGDIKNIISQLNNKPFIYETKFDGERVQLHKDGDMYRYWSRNGLEWTKSYGLTKEVGTLTPYISEIFMETVNNCILDGEMMGYNNVTKTMGSKAEEFDIKNINVERLSGYLPCFVIFDVLYLNDEILTNDDVLERKRVLDTQILKSEIEGKIQICKYTQATSREECVNGFNRAIENCDEGIIVKRIDSVYQVNSRKAGWFKIKPDYVLGLNEELDCVIVGGYFTGGKIISHFLCAVKSRNDEDGSDKFLSFCKVGSGFTRNILYQFNLKMALNWKAYKKESPPSWLVLASRFREKPDIFIEPCHSFIVQLKAAEIVSSENYATKCTLRFSRLDCFREDKSPTDDCMTLIELETLRSHHNGKLALHPLEIDSEEDNVTSNCTQKKPRIKRKLQLPECYRSEVPNKQLISENIENSIFSGKEFSILISAQFNKDLDKNHLEKFVYENGGIVVQNPSKSTNFVIANRQTLKIQNLIKTKLYDILTLDWLVECFRENKFITLKPSHYICMKSTTAEYFKDLYDIFGDSFIEEITTEELKDLLRDIETKDLKILDLPYEKKASFLNSNSFNDLSSTYLIGYVINFYIPPNYPIRSIVEVSEVHRWKIGLKLSGAKITDDILSPIITHVVVPRGCMSSDIRAIHMLNRERDYKFFIICTDWVVKVLQSSSRVPEIAYMIKK